MPRIPDNARRGMILYLFLTFSVGVYGHGEDRMTGNEYMIKDRIHDLCSGHGAMHLTSDELNELFSQFPEHYQEITSLVGEANSDNYLVQLTTFIERSVLPDEQKMSAYKVIHSRVASKLKEGDEWNRTLRKLVRIPDVLTIDELKVHLDSEDKVLVDRVRKTLLERRREEDRRLREPVQDSRVNGIGNPSGEIDSVLTADKDSENSKFFVLAIAGILLVGVLLHLKVFKRQSTN